MSLGELRLRSPTGEEIESELAYALTRADAFAPIEPELELRGMYRYMADAAVFRECLTNRVNAVQFRATRYARSSASAPSPLERPAVVLPDSRRGRDG
jgi:copper homeostasis protein (lipoprotein)